MNKLSQILIFLKGSTVRLFFFLRFEIFGYLNILPLLRRRNDKTFRIAFQSYSPHLAQMFKPVIEKLKKESSVRIFFLIMFHPFHGMKGLRATRDYAVKQLGIPPGRVLMIWQATWEKWDVLICNDMYAKFPLRRKRTIVLPHGSGFTPRKIKRNLFRKTIYDFDYSFHTGEFDYTLARSYIKDRPVCFITGFPFIDTLVVKEGKNGSSTPFTHEDSQKVVLFAPHWVTSHVYGREHRVWISVIAKVCENLGHELWIKPHAVSYRTIQPRPQSWMDVIRPFRDKKSIRILEDMDDIPYLKRADVLITDISGRAHNFMVMDKPVILIPPPPGYTDHPLHRSILDEVRRGAYCIQNVDELPTTMERCLSFPEEMSVQRHEVVKRFFSHIGNAAEETVRQILILVNGE
jgi:CDP-glycerol glycerophosphotransferase (TagB/SpsB family)